MFCKKCGEKIIDGAKFCPKCGMRFDLNREAEMQKNGQKKALDTKKKNKKKKKQGKKKKRKKINR